MVVVLPAPLRPTSPMRSPGCTRSAAPSVDSSVRAPARTSRSVAVITLLLPFVLMIGYLSSVKTGGPLLGARRDRFFEVAVSKRTKSCPRPSACMCPSRLAASSPLHSVRLVNSIPGRENDAIRSPSSIANVEQLVVRHGPGHQADAFGFVGVDVAPGEHQLEGPRRADRARQQVGQAELAGGQAVVDARRAEIGP